MKAYVARIELLTDETIIGTPNFMLGGVRINVSSPFQDRHDAVAFAEQSIQVNRQRPGHALDRMDYDILTVESRNPIPTSGLYGSEISQVETK